MKLLKIISILTLTLVLPNVFAKDGDPAEKQTELDRACEEARQIELAPLKNQYIEECVVKEKKERAYCEKFYSDYGNQAGNRAALFYDLPKCVEAFEYRQRYRQSN